MNLEMSIEAVLFYKTEPMKKATLAELFSVSLEEIDAALVTLSESLTMRGIRLVITDTLAQLVTAPEASDIVDLVRKEELKSDIGKAGAETLSIILYRGPLSRIELDKIRGVNSSFILRNLLIRGLIERRPHPTDSRSFIYATTPALLNHLGISKREELPEYEQILNALEQFETQNTEDVPPPNETAS